MYHTGKLSVVMAFGEVLLMLMVLSVGGVQGEASQPNVLMLSRSSQ